MNNLKNLDLTIIIVSYNSLGFLKACLDSIYKNPPGPGYEIVVVDNASTDGTPGFIEKNYPGAALISNSKNVGFAAANNQAIARTRSDYILLINSDCEVYGGSLDKLIKFIDGNPEIGIAGPRIINSDGSIQPSCRNFPSFFNAAAHTLLTNIYPDNPFSKKYKLMDVSRDRPFKVDWVSGSAMMIRRAALADTGLLDENYFMYVEDLDICYRMRQADWKVYYTPDSRILHHAGGSGGKNIRSSFRMQKSVLYFFWKNYKKTIKIVFIPFLVLGLGFRFLLSAARVIFKR